METITRTQIGAIADVLRDFMEEIESYFDEAPKDYGDRKDGFEQLIISILEEPEHE